MKTNQALISTITKLEEKICEITSFGSINGIDKVIDIESLEAKKVVLNLHTNRLYSSKTEYVKQVGRRTKFEFIETAVIFNKEAGLNSCPIRVGSMKSLEKIQSSINEATKLIKKLKDYQDELPVLNTTISELPEVVNQIKEKMAA